MEVLNLFKKKIMMVRGWLKLGDILFLIGSKKCRLEKFKGKLVLCCNFFFYFYNLFYLICYLYICIM